MVRQSSVLGTARWLRVLVVMAALMAATAALPAARAAAASTPIGSHAAVLGSPNSGNMAVFFNSNGTLEENFYFVSSNTWSGPMVLPGGGISDFDSPQAVGSPNGGNIAVFYTSNGALMYDFYLVSSNTWAGPFEVAPDIVGDPAVAGNPNGGNMAVFWRDSHNHLNEDFYFVATNTWGGAFPIATSIDDSPVAIGSPDSGNLAVYYTSNGVLLERYYLGSNNSWIGPFQLATQVKGPVAVLGSPDSGNIAVFYTAVLSNGTSLLREVYYTVATNSWGGPYQLPGNPANGPPRRDRESQRRQHRGVLRQCQQRGLGAGLLSGGHQQLDRPDRDRLDRGAGAARGGGGCQRRQPGGVLHRRSQRAEPVRPGAELLLRFQRHLERPDGNRRHDHLTAKYPSRLPAAPALHPPTPAGGTPRYLEGRAWNPCSGQWV